MPEPTYSESTEQLYAELPEFYRTYDAEPEQDWAFKKYVASFGELAQPILTLLNRFWFETQEAGGPGFVNGAAGNCDLANPARADDAWLRWLAQVLGVSLRGMVGATPAETEAKQRLWMSDPQEARRAGSRASLIAFGTAVLTGTQYVEVYARTADTGAIGAAGEWDVAMVFRMDEMVADPAAAVIAAGAKPAGWLLTSRAVENIWGDVHALGTWGTATAGRTWGDVRYDVL